MDLGKNYLNFQVMALAAYSELTRYNPVKIEKKRKYKLTPKQKKARAKSKHAKKLRTKNRR